MLRVCSSSTGDNLTTLSNLKGVLEIPNVSTSYDDLLTFAITNASRAIQDVIGYPLMRQVYSETVPSYGDNRLMLKRTPVRSIASISLDDSVIGTTEYFLENDEAGIVWRDAGWGWSAGIEWDLVDRAVPGSERKWLTVEYEAGYLLTTTTGSTGTLRTLPPSIEEACIDVAKTWFLKRKADPTVDQKKVGDLQIRYKQLGSDPFDLTTKADNLINPYRRMF